MKRVPPPVRSDRAGAGSPTTGVAPPALRQTLDALRDNLRPSGAAAVREFEFTRADFERIRQLIRTHAGISLTDSKQDMVYGRLARRLRACGDREFAQYLARLERDSTELEAFINSLTTNLTSFFREPHHFEFLAAHLKQLAPRAAREPVRIWCCASSTGEEPYSLAITACEAFASLSPPVRIIASDIDTQVLAQARAGVYAEDRVARMDPARLKRFFSPVAGGYQAKSELQRLITFQRINLLDRNWPLQGQLDLIFCRNVMIYFDKPTQLQILSRFVPLLRDDGLLVAGHSESFLHAAAYFRSRGRTIYEKVPPATR